MMMTKLLTAAILTMALSGAAFAATTSYEATGTSMPQSTTFGTTGASVGTVTAPSIGSYNWPSVGVTNAVPTWNNTNPPVRK